MRMRARDYPWLFIGNDGSIDADMICATDAESDRRLVIVQEISAGRLTLTNGVVNADPTEAATP